MHPIERLRYVARADGAGPGVLVRETGLALCDMDLDPQSLVLACRRIVERHPTMAQLWWLCAHVLAAPDPFSKARELALVVEHDDTPGHLDDALPDDARAMIVGWPFTTVKCLAQRGDALMLVVDSHGEGEALVERLHDADIAAELVPFEYVSAAVSRRWRAALAACWPSGDHAQWLTLQSPKANKCGWLPAWAHACRPCCGRAW